MRLYDISEEARSAGLENANITGITDNSEEFETGNVFVCIKGQNFDGHSLARETLEKGAAAVVAERDLNTPKQIIVPDTRKYYAKLSSAFFNKPTEKLKLVAVTGTNGKSTVISIIKHILEKQGCKTGSVGTVNYDTAGEIYEARLTVPYPPRLYGLFAEMVSNGAEYAVIEASSQALSQNRFAEDEIFECAIFTNLTQDHLDWHKTMDNYYKAKRSLFDMAKRAVINIDGKYGEKLIKYTRDEKNIPAATYSIGDFADYYAVNIKTSASGVSFWLSSAQEEKTYPVKLAMPGVYNAANTLAAVGACVGLGIDFAAAVDSLSDFKGVGGRSEIIYSGDFTVIRDYAHTEDALVKFLSGVREFTENRLICVFGAPGERDFMKRPLMGKAVDNNADYMIITSDNPRFESQSAIIEQVVKGVRSSSSYETIPNRREAIEKAVKMAEKGDVLTLCGKGHETYQVIGDEYLPFDEKEIVLEAIKEYKGC